MDSVIAPVARVWEKPRLTVKKYWQLESRAKPKRTTALFGAAAERHLQCALSSRAPCKPAPRGSEVPGACTGFSRPSRPHSSFQSLPAPSGSHPGWGAAGRGCRVGISKGGSPSPAPSSCQAAACPPCPQPTQNWHSVLVEKTDGKSSEPWGGSCQAAAWEN